MPTPSKQHFSNARPSKGKRIFSTYPFFGLWLATVLKLQERNGVGSFDRSDAALGRFLRGVLRSARWIAGETHWTPQEGVTQLGGVPSVESLPSSLTELILHPDFNQSLEKVLWPGSLQSHLERAERLAGQLGRCARWCALLSAEEHFGSFCCVRK